MFGAARRRGKNKNKAEVESLDHLALEKFEEIVSMLIDAGYYRARIETLSMFDRCIGGLCWAITASGVAVDVEILFEENMDLGRKVQLSEDVCNALQGMKCPSPLLAHQVQGHDFPAIYPVMKWLIKMVVATRDTRARIVRDYAHHYFGKSYEWPEEFKRDDSFLEVVVSEYHNRRSMKRPKNMWESKDGTELSEDLAVQACLLEYGEQVGSSEFTDIGDFEVQDASASPTAGSSTLSAFERKFAKMEAQEESKRQEAMEAAMQQQQQMLQQMSAAGDKAMNRGAVGNIVMQEGDLISNATAKYNAEVAETRRLMEEREPLTRRGRAAAFKRRQAGILRQLKAAKLKLKVASARRAKVKERYDKVKALFDDAKKYNARIVLETKKLEKLEAKEEYADNLARLKELIMINESLKQQEKSFKENCRRQQKEFQATISALTDGTGNDADINRLLEIEDMFNEVSSKYAKGRQLIAKKNRDIQTLLRKIDGVPTRAELMQYERRFVELNDQMAANLEETRKYFAKYNTLNETRQLLESEATLIQSINDNFQKAMKSKTQKEQFLQSCRSTIKTLAQKKRQQEGTLATMKQEVDKLAESHQVIIDKQRKYFKAVRSFQEACDENERLTNLLEDA